MVNCRQGRPLQTWQWFLQLMQRRKDWNRLAYHGQEISQQEDWTPRQMSPPPEVASLICTWGIILSSQNIFLLSVIIICVIWPFTKIHHLFLKKNRQMEHTLPPNCHLSTIVAEDCLRAWKPGYNWNTTDIVYGVLIFLDTRVPRTRWHPNVIKISMKNAPVTLSEDFIYFKYFMSPLLRDRMYYTYT